MPEFLRELTELEERVLAYIRNHPRLTHEDIAQAEEFAGEPLTHYAIQYLVWNLYVDCADETLALTVKE